MNDFLHISLGENKGKYTTVNNKNMSTRTNVIITSNTYREELWFYRHSDGYPGGVEKTLGLFLSWVKEKKIRDNVSQSAGWLIIIGAIEYGSIPEFDKKPDETFHNHKVRGYGILDTINVYMNDRIDFKCGAYEPTTGMHGDIEHLYVIDLDEKIVKEIEIPAKQDEWPSSKVIQVMNENYKWPEPVES